MGQRYCFTRTGRQADRGAWKAPDLLFQDIQWPNTRDGARIDALKSLDTTSTRTLGVAFAVTAGPSSPGPGPLPPPSWEGRRRANWGSESAPCLRLFLLER